MVDVSNRLYREAAVLAFLAMITIPVRTADSVPDFSGRWGRNAFNFEPLPNVPRPLTNLKRRANGAGDPTQLVVIASRPLCRYPFYPRYNGSGDANLASGFTCSP